MVSTQDGYTVLGRHSSNISEWISVHIGTYCIRMDNNIVQQPDKMLKIVETKLVNSLRNFSKGYNNAVELINRKGCLVFPHRSLSQVMALKTIEISAVHRGSMKSYEIRVWGVFTQSWDIFPHVPACNLDNAVRLQG